MPLRRASDEDLLRLAELNLFELTPDELSAFQSFFPAMFEALDQLVVSPSGVPPLAHTDRDPGSRPPPEENPLNAIVRRCSVKGASSGKLKGKRIGLKDNTPVAGVPMTCGSLVLEGYIPDMDATVVTRLLDEGAEIVAMLNMDNFAFSGGGMTSDYGPTLNPHNPGYVAGGSSGGSGAGLYYDEIDMTLGGDQGGSIRIPSSFCGVVGLKPTHGLVPYTGIIGIDPCIDHTGPMTRSVADCALLLEVLAGKDGLDPRQGEDVKVEAYTEALGKDIKGLRIGVLREGFGTAVSEPDVDAAVRDAIDVLSGLGAKVSEISVPMHNQIGGILWAIIAEGMHSVVDNNGVGYLLEGLQNTSLAAVLGKARYAQADDFPPTLKLTLLLGAYLKEHYHGQLYAKAKNLRADVRKEYDRAFQDVDVIAMPTTPMKAQTCEPDLPMIEIVGRGWAMLGNTSPFNVTGHPSLNVPCAKSNGLPVGLMLTGRRFEDATLFQVAHAYEQKVTWDAA